MGRTLIRGALRASVGVALIAAGTAPPIAAANPGNLIPDAPKFEHAGGDKWVWKIDPERYGGAKGTITFYDEGFRGPGGTGPNDYRVGEGFDADDLSFVQNVTVVPRDGLTRDPVHDVFTDDPLGMAQTPSSALKGANMDGSVNLGGFAWTVPPGTKFVNMQIDRPGNYFVAKEDMHWGFFDYFDYQQGTAKARRIDTNFNFQPYPLSDGYGVCGTVMSLGPHALQRQQGHLTFDVAFDVYPANGRPGQSGADTQVIPGFVARSYGRYVVDVVNPMGQRQFFQARTTSINHNPLTGELDERYRQLVSPVAAGVVPTGAWVIGRGADTKVVPEGTPGSRFHRNKFAGFAYMLRGDIRRSIEDQTDVEYEQRQTWTAYPLDEAMKRPAGLRGVRVRRSGSLVRIVGRAARTADGRVRVTALGRAAGSRKRVARTVRMRGGRFATSLRIPKASRTRLVIRYMGDDTHRRQTVRRRIPVR